LIWLWQNGWILPWLAGALTATMSGAFLLWRLRSKAKPLQPFPGVQPDPRWPDSSGQAWAKVTDVRDGMDIENISMDDYPQMLEIGQQVME
jgi:hypothetical protein